MTFRIWTFPPSCISQKNDYFYRGKNMERRRIILIVDDDQAFLELLEKRFNQNGFATLCCKTATDAMKIINSHSLDVAILDLVLPDRNGIDVLEYLKKSHPECPAIMLTGYGTIDVAVEAMKKGAYDFLTKPVSFGELFQRIDRAIKFSVLQQENIRLKAQLEDRFYFERMVGRSKPMLQLYRIIERVARTDATVLITGESGTGKELVAQAIHQLSNRKNKPFIPVNCGAIPTELLESEFFGHEKGAFSGAIRTRPGRFELAHGGTVFLDEIAEMSPKLQVKLLRFLQDRRFERIGGTRTIEVDVRVISATNKDLWKAVQEGDFREDLYYRLNVIPIHVPPLRERKEDIPLLVNHFLDRHCRVKGLPSKSIHPDVIRCFEKYSWPGNVRELENLLERLVILAEGDEITINDLPDRFLAHAEKKEDSFKITVSDEGINLKQILEQLEVDLILQALNKTNGVKNRAAKLLGLNRTTLIEKMKKYKIKYPPPK